MRQVLISEECFSFIESNLTIKKKFQYLLQILIEQKVVHSDIIKKLTGTPFYELRIKVNQEYRIILISYENQNFVESTKVVLLNGFIKKSTIDYRMAIETAYNLIEKYKI